MSIPYIKEILILWKFLYMGNANNVAISLYLRNAYNIATYYLTDIFKVSISGMASHIYLNFIY